MTHLVFFSPYLRQGVSAFLSSDLRLGLSAFSGPDCSARAFRLDGETINAGVNVSHVRISPHVYYMLRSRKNQRQDVEILFTFLDEATRCGFLPNHSWRLARNNVESKSDRQMWKNEP